MILSFISFERQCILMMTVILIGGAYLHLLNLFGDAYAHDMILVPDVHHESGICTKQTHLRIGGDWFTGVEQDRHGKPCSNDSVCMYGTCHPDATVEASYSPHIIDSMIEMRDKLLGDPQSDFNIGDIMMKSIYKLQVQEFKRRNKQKI